MLRGARRIPGIVRCPGCPGSATESLNYAGRCCARALQSHQDAERVRPFGWSRGNLTVPARNCWMSRRVTADEDLALAPGESHSQHVSQYLVDVPPPLCKRLDRGPFIPGPCGTEPNRSCTAGPRFEIRCAAGSANGSAACSERVQGTRKIVA